MRQGAIVGLSCTLTTVLLGGLPAGTAAQRSGLYVSVGGVDDPATLARGVALVLDADDDDEDGRADAAQGGGNLPLEDVLPLRVSSSLPITLRPSPGVRLVQSGHAIEGELTLPAQTVSSVGIQGTRTSTRTGDAHLEIRSGEETVRVAITVVALSFLGAENQLLHATRDAVGVSHRITNDASLPRTPAYETVSPDPDNIRLEIHDPALTGRVLLATIESAPASGGRPRASRRLTLTRPREGLPFRSPWVRLVGDEMDTAAPGVADRLLRVSLRDEVRLRYVRRGSVLSQSMRVGRPGDEDGPMAVRRGTLRVRVLQGGPGGIPSVGTDHAGALRLGREQVRIANEVWLQCFTDFGPPELADVQVVAAPPASLIAIADRNGLPARGGGSVRLRVDGRPIRPVRTHAGAAPIQTALDLSDAIRALGYRARVTQNPATEPGAGESADVLVRDAAGHPVPVAPDGDSPLSTDARQTVSIGHVDLSDGLQEFDNMTAAAGTLEERAMIKALADDDPTTVDIFIINRFTGGTRQGEAFIESDGGAIINALILDRNGMRQQREAWTQSHELGHILLDQPFHPDNVGPDHPWLLMDADSSLGLITGPKRLSWDECHRARARSGVGAMPALLRRHDERSSTPPRLAQPFDRGYVRP